MIPPRLDSRSVLRRVGIIVQTETHHGYDLSSRTIESSLHLSTSNDPKRSPRRRAVPRAASNAFGGTSSLCSSETNLSSARRPIYPPRSQVTLDEELFHKLRRTVHAQTSARERAEAQNVELVARLKSSRAVEDLEEKLQDLRGQKMELDRELALREKKFATESSFEARMKTLQNAIDVWGGCCTELRETVQQEQRAFGSLRRGLKFLGSFPLIKNDKLFRPGVGAGEMQEGRSRTFCWEEAEHV